jgi:hypothetical protein
VDNAPVGAGASLKDIIPSVARAPIGLPKTGRVGDLLVTINPDDSVCTLWLCIKQATTSTEEINVCSWAQVLLGQEVVAS